MTHQIKLSERAIADLLEIRRWIKSEADEVTAHQFVDRIYSKISTLSDYPKRGAERPGVREGTRQLSFERRYIILYRVTIDTVSIDRVVSGSRNLDQIS
jgi:addiction module RelE/StbE family toxin